MAESICFKRRFKRVPVALAMALASPIAVHAATTQQVSFASGHVVVEADPAVDRFALSVSGAPGHCDPELRVDEQAQRIAVVRGNGACKDDVVVTFRVNPAWADQLDMTLALGQIDLAASILAASSRIEAKVGVGDIVGRSGVSRSWLLGATFTLDQHQPGLVIRTKVRSGQISFM